MNRTTVILTFDMEPDLGSWTTALRGVTEGTPRILDVLRNHRVPATFFWTGREASARPHIVERVLSGGHEVGCHTLLHEIVGVPVYDTIWTKMDDEVEGRLAKATDAIERVAGVRPVSFRAPCLFGSTRMIRALEDLGYAADSSLPAYFHGRGFLPYHPSHDDWTRAGHMRLLEVPVFYNLDAGDDNESKQRSRDQWPVLRLRGGRAFADLCLAMAERVKDDPGGPYLCVYLHPWEFAEMPATIYGDEASITFKPFLYERSGREAVEALDEFLEIMTGAGARFLTLESAAAGFDA